MKFSVVVPAKDEIELINATLPSYYEIQPDEVIICTDKPCLKTLEMIVNLIADCYPEVKTKIVEVERDPEWRFHQAHVRRSGFKETEHNRILTGDIDLIVNNNVHKALKLVGKDNVGLASLSKLWYPRELMDYWRIGVLTFLRTVVHGMLDPIVSTSTFSGLYAFWRPYWLDSEPEEEVKRMVNPKQLYRGEKVNLENYTGMTGEDTFLKDHMMEKHKCVFLRTVGALDFGKPVENMPFIQYMKGQYFARQGRSLPISVGRAFLRGQPYYLQGYLAEKYKRGK